VLLGIVCSPALQAQQTGTTESGPYKHFYRKLRSLFSGSETSGVFLCKLAGRCRLLSACRCTCKSVLRTHVISPQPEGPRPGLCPCAGYEQGYITPAALWSLSCCFLEFSSIKDALDLLSSQQENIKSVPNPSTSGDETSPLRLGAEAGCSMSPCRVWVSKEGVKQPGVGWDRALCFVWFLPI